MKLFSTACAIIPLIVPSLASYRTGRPQLKELEDPPRRQLNTKQRDDGLFSFRLRLFWLPGVQWEYENDGWCMECKYSGQKNTCREGDEIALDLCGSSDRQRFVYTETGQGEGRFMPQSNPNLCFTWSSTNGRTVLSDCDAGNPDQIFVGFEPGHSFELQTKSALNGCLAPGSNGEELLIYTLDCATALLYDTSRWEATYRVGEYSGYVPPTDPCPEVCIDVYQDQRRTFVGQYRPVSTPQSVAIFYQYNGKSNTSYNGEKFTPLSADTSIIFAHQDSMYCDLSLVTVHGTNELDAGERCTPGSVLLHITGDLENCVVQDGRFSPSDTFTYNSGRDETACDWYWSWQSKCRVRTDGLAHLWDPSKQECLRVRPGRFDGIEHWKFVPGPRVSGTPAKPEDYVSLDMEEDLEMCLGTCQP